MTDVKSSARPEITSLKPYESARSLALSGRIFLDANEAPNCPIPGSNLNRYPEPQPRALVDRLCEYYGISPDGINPALKDGVSLCSMMVVRGSDEAIDLLNRVFCVPGRDKILVCPPTYGMYEVCARIQGAGIVRVPLQFKEGDFRLDIAGIQEALERTDSIKIIFLCSPNNPTGTAFPVDVLDQICRLAEGKCLVVVDEAYAEFNSEDRFSSTPLCSVISKIKAYPHLIVLRTLSKAWALAGVRCGVALGQKVAIDLLQKVRPPYPLSTPSVQAVLQGTDSVCRELLSRRVQDIRVERERLRKELLVLPAVKMVFPSVTNFLLVQFKESARIFEGLKACGTILRDRNREPGLDGCIRITIGSPEENHILISQLRKLVFVEMELNQGLSEGIYDSK